MNPDGWTGGGAGGITYMGCDDKTEWYIRVADASRDTGWVASTPTWDAATGEPVATHMNVLYSGGGVANHYLDIYVAPLADLPGP